MNDSLHPVLGKKLSGLLAAFGIGMLLISANIAPSPAKPMNPASLKEAISRSEQIVVAEFETYTVDKPVHYFSAPEAIYQIRQTLYGKRLPTSTKIHVRYLFHDLSPCMEPTEWTFDETKEMPAPKSAWILFLLPKEKNRPVYDLYRGSYGRWPADAKHLQEVKAALKKAG